MRRLRTALAVVVITLVAAAVVVALVAAFPAGREALATLALRAVIWQRGYHLTHGSLALGPGTASIDKLRITDRNGELFASADRVAIAFDPAGLIGRSDRMLGLRRIVFDAPRLYLIRHRDGSWNFQQLLPHGPGAGVTAGGPALPWRMALEAHDGIITVLDPQAITQVGKSFSINGIQARLDIAQGASSTGALSASLRTVRGDAAVSGTLMQDDVVGFGRASIALRGVPLAPVVDAIVPTQAFVIQGGLADVDMLAYTIGDPGGPPAWHMSGDARVRIARLHVSPLAVPVRDIACVLHYQDGLLSTRSLTGVTAATPLHAQGAIQILGPLRIAFGARQTGRLERERALFSFSAAQPVRGPFEAAVRIDGPLSDLRVAGTFHLRDASYADVALPTVNGTLYYEGSHLTVTGLDLDRAGARAWATGDFELGRRVLATVLVVATAPARSLPFVANVVPAGNARALATAQGPIDGLSASGYVTAAGGVLRLQSFFSIDPRAAFYGPARMTMPGGEAVAAVEVRHVPRPATISAALVANNARLRVQGGRSAFADAAGLGVTLPSLDTTLNGVAVIDGSGLAPAIAVNATAARLQFAGVDLGDATLRARGDSGRVHVAQATLARSGLRASAHGDLDMGPHLNVEAANLSGDGSLELASLASVVPSLHPRGVASGKFWVTVTDTGYVFVLRAHGSTASLGGIPVRSGTIAAVSRGQTTRLLANLATKDAEAWAAGDVAQAGSGSSAHLTAFSPRLSLAAIPLAGSYVRSGNATAVATINGPLNAPQIAAAAVGQTTLRGAPLAGDIDVRYSDSVLHSDDTRISAWGSRATITGDVVQPAALTRHLALDVNVRDGDLAGLDRASGRQAQLAGDYQAVLRVDGDFAHPQLDGTISAPVGTIRGVTFNDLQGRMSAGPGQLALHGASVRLNDSRFALDGDLGGSAFAVRAESPHVDMSDFNDFFGGKDVFAGRGDFSLDVRRNAGELTWGGRFVLADATLSGFRLGRIDADFTSRRGALRAVVQQSGDVGATTLSGSARVHSTGSHLPDLRNATYRVRASVRNLDMTAVLPLLHEEQLGLSGRLDAQGRMTGTLRNPIGNATFDLHDGHMRRMPIQHLSGALESDADGVTLEHADLTLPYLVANAQGRYGFAGRTIAGRATLSAADLASVANAMKVPGSLGGSASAVVTVSGDLHRPKAAAKVDASRATLYGIAFDRATINATYAPGAIGIGDTELAFAGGRGVLSVAGELPIQLQPLALGPKERPVELTMQAEKIDLSVLDPLLGRFATLTGNLNAGASITGTAGNPKGKGTAQIRYASVRSDVQTVPLTDVSADIGFDQDTITLRTLSGKAGSGTFAASGSAHIVPAVGLRNNAGLQFSSHLALRRAQIDVPGWINGTLDGDLSVTRSGLRPYVEGSVAAQNAVIPFSAIYDLATGSAAAVARSAPEQAPGVPELTPGHTIVYGGGVWGGQQHMLTNIIGQPTPQPTGVSLPPVDVNLAVTAGNNVRVRGGSAIDLTTGGGVVISGSLQAPQLDGQFYAVRGQVGYFDTNFRLVSGTVTFDHETGLLPTMDIVAVTNSGSTEITLHVTGRVDNLNTELSSTPAMSKDQIVATLLHAPQLATLTNATPTQAQTTLTQTAQSYFNAQLSRSLLYPFESALAQQLNIESISFIFNAQGQLAVEFRTRVAPTISAVYQTTLEVPVTQSYGVSYRLRDYLSLDLVEAYPNLSVNSTTTTTLNLQYQFH